MSQVSVAPVQNQTADAPSSATTTSRGGGSDARSSLKSGLAGQSFDVQAKALSAGGLAPDAPLQLKPAASPAGAPVQRRERAVQRNAPAATPAPTNAQSTPGGQQTDLSGIDVARHPSPDPNRLGNPVDQTTQASIDDPLKHPYYPTFEARVVALFASGKVGNAPQPPVTIAKDVWQQICTAVKASQPSMDDPATYSNWARKWVDMTSPGFQTAIGQFQAVCTQISGYTSTQFANSSSFGFWSKPEGRELSESLCDVTLETSGIGAIFDALPTLNGNSAGWDPQLWGALSRSYAAAVANAVSAEGKRVHVCIGAYPPGGNIWEAVESKTLAKGLGDVGLTLKDRVTYHGAAATTKANRALDKGKKSGSGTYPGCVYSGPSRDDAIAAANVHYDALPA